MGDPPRLTEIAKIAKFCRKIIFAHKLLTMTLRQEGVITTSKNTLKAYLMLVAPLRTDTKSILKKVQKATYLATILKNLLLNATFVARVRANC